ncbi:MAG: 50S ribosomal protein L18 [Candidatus Cloacimonetes bacterium]|nr:50S ribosomal protein L18 [Candidatus Cloacimonadota bacterium]
MIKSITRIKSDARNRRRKAIRKFMNGDADRPRLAVFRSNKNIYAQIINDETGKTIVSMSTMSKDADLKKEMKKCEQSFAIGLALGKKAVEAGVKHVCFDRSGFRYHGRVKQLADGVRKATSEAGIKDFV